MNKHGYLWAKAFMREEYFTLKCEPDRIILNVLLSLTYQWWCFATPLTKINKVNFISTHSTLVGLDNYIQFVYEWIYT